MAVRLILASGSPRRRELLSAMGASFEVITSNVDETPQPGEIPYDYAERLAREKAAAVAARLPADEPWVVLAADTVVVAPKDSVVGIEVQGDLLEKPADADEARDMLLRLRGQRHTVCTAVVAFSGGTLDERLVSRRAFTQVHMRDYSDTEMEAYIASGDPFDKAGGYAIQNEDFRPVERIEGCYNNVVGLPLNVVKWALAQVEWPGAHFLKDCGDCDCLAINGADSGE